MKLITITLAVLSLVVGANAQIGRTLDDCVKAYGKFDTVDRTGNGYLFETQTVPEIWPKDGSDLYAPEFHYFPMVELVDGRVSKITYMISGTEDRMYILDAEYLLKKTAPEAVWNEPTKHAERADVFWTGSVNGAVKYHAHLEGVLSLEITDDETTAGGVFGAKREIMDGHEVTVLPGDKSTYESSQGVAPTLTPTPFKPTLESAEADLAHAWKSLTAEQRAQLNQEQQKWTKNTSSLPEEERIKSTVKRANYLWSLVDRTLDD